jgi:uncharacterized cofD-like protein
MLPPGDVRKCLVALSDESPLLGELMKYRFASTGGRPNEGDARTTDTPPAGAGTNGSAEYGELAGHSFGNLFLTVLWQLTGDFSEAVRQAGRILSIRGRVVPATLDRVSLVATHVDGSHTVGQRQISESPQRIQRVAMRPNPGPASRDIIDAIEKAELIVIGPGSLYTSVIPNLLINGIPEAVRRSEAVKVFVANVASNEGETRDFSLRDHLDAILEHVSPLPVDIVLVSATAVPSSTTKVFAESGAKLVRFDPREFDAGNADPSSADRADTDSGRYSREYGVRFVESDLASHEDPCKHDPRKLARALVSLLAAERDRE